MKKFIVFLTMIVFFMSCREKEILTSKEFYTSQIPVKVPIDSTWAKGLELNRIFTIKSDSLSPKFLKYSFYNQFAEPTGNNCNFKLIDEVDFSNILFFKIDSINTKYKVYNIQLLFNSGGLKEFLKKYSQKANELYGSSPIGLGVTITRNNTGFNEDFTNTLKAGTSVNVDLMENNKLITYKDLCSYYQNLGTGKCERFPFNGNYQIGEKFNFNFYLFVGPENRKCGSYYASSKTYSFDLLDFAKLR